MKHLDQYEAACKVRRQAARTIPTYRRWVEEFLLVEGLLQKT